MNSRQRNRRMSRLRKSPDFPPSHRRRAVGQTEDITPATPQAEAPDVSPTETG
jgi:hypothetical protein